MKNAAACALTIVSMLLSCPSAWPKVVVPRLISKGMVLQRDREVRIWGWATPAERVTIRFLGETRSTVTSADSMWEIMLPPMKAGGPYCMEIDGENHIVIGDILIGDVWVCSGQSNMELPMERVKPRYEQEIRQAEFPQIRQFDVPHVQDFGVPHRDLPTAQWEEANPWSVLRFTATGFFFAKSLWEKYHVPIGLLNASVGGTPIQAWLSREVLGDFPADLAAADAFSRESYRDSVRRSNEAVSDAWNNRVWADDLGLSGKLPWYDPAFDASGWATMKIPGFWSEEGVKERNGVVWFRRSFALPASLAGKAGLLLLGRIVDADYAYINGVLVGSTAYQYPPRRYRVSAGILKAGNNEIVVRVMNSGGRGGFVTNKPYELRVDGRTVALGGMWRYAVGAAEPPMGGTTTIAYQPAGCFNGMIAPLSKYRIKGVAWYQGESNCGSSAGYDRKLKGMITDWRRKWSDSLLPFLVVQLPNYGEAADTPSQSGMAEVRYAQFKALSLPQTGLAVAIDLGEWNDIHPLNKEDVGKRLALAAGHVAYGEAHEVWSGPLFQSMRVEGSTIVVTFTSVGSGLKFHDGKQLKRFEISGDGATFVCAEARISGNAVVVSSPGIYHPVAVRYAWADNPAGANLSNKEGLPASPFECR